MRYVLLVQYDGTGFSGFQKQKKGERTVQGELERAAAEIFGTPTRVSASGRTDAGVHARGQVADLIGETSVPPERLFLCFNRILPPDLRVLASAAAPEGFDCTRAVKKKTYAYTFYHAPAELPLLERYAVRVPVCPDIERMRSAARLLTGEHDFKAFSATGSSAKTTVRTVYGITVGKRTEAGAEIFRIAVTGNGFLYNMVRILAGELVSIGCGKGIDDIERAFETGDRRLVAKTMPARGLTLEQVDYGFPLFGEKE